MHRVSIYIFVWLSFLNLDEQKTYELMRKNPFFSLSCVNVSVWYLFVYRWAAFNCVWEMFVLILRTERYMWMLCMCIQMDRIFFSCALSRIVSIWKKVTQIHGRRRYLTIHTNQHTIEMVNVMRYACANISFQKKMFILKTSLYFQWETMWM